ncbi:MAG: hypothetical protein DRQ60_08520 [Gammaproteobacteria bacterium]|nr:MAG: hypothetical protein DRQ60_08520 [Gammaproteobacteria bacterium]
MRSIVAGASGQTRALGRMGPIIRLGAVNAVAWDRAESRDFLGLERGARGKSLQRQAERRRGGSGRFSTRSPAEK